jgi:23S rRNA (cytidine1920-2'-O)/16S rRNA (cytidine1409-2'-O)-methyltransferase
LDKRRVCLRELVKIKYPHLSADKILALILCGDVRADGERLKDPHQMVCRDTSIEIVARKRFVSRGGEKLDRALEDWKLPVEGLVFIDAGCSTGGFTDCLLNRGARLVHAVDVGYSQLDYRLRSTKRVKVYERTNIMTAERSFFDPEADAAVVDLSFRSIVGAGSHILGLVKKGWLISLIKPQFEWRKPSKDFKGVVKDRKVLQDILIDLVNRLWENRSYVTRVAPSPIRGRKGNREFFFLIRNKAVFQKQVIQSNIQRLILDRDP